MRQVFRVLLSVCVVWPAGLWSQNYFQHNFTLPDFSVQTGAVARLSNGRIAAAGTITRTQDGRQDAAVLSLSSSGNLLWARTLDAGLPQEPELIADLLDGSNGAALVVLGKSAQMGGISGVLQLDADGAIVWSKRLSGADQFTGITKLSAGYLLTGSSGTPGKGLLVNISATGQEIWRRTLEQPGAAITFYDAWEDPQGFLYVVGEIAQQDGILAQFNAAGELVWARRLGTPETDGLRAIVPQPDNKLLLGGATRGFDLRSKVWLTQTDLLGNVRWSSTYGGGGEDYLLQDLIATGQTPVFCFSGAGASSILGAGMARINDGGDLLWVKNYDPAGQFSLTPQLAPGLNNSLLLAATLQTGAGNGFYVVSANATGDAPPCCFKSANLTVADVTIQNTAFVPNTGTIPVLLAGNWVADTLALEQTSLCNPANTEIALSDSVICPGECIDLTIVDPTPGAAYSWSYPGGQPVPGNPNRVCFPGVSADVLITLFGNNCPFQQDTALLRVGAAPEQFPNAFTPNGDGDNDRFLPLLYCPLTDYLFRVYNRWGEMMFETRNPGEGWDGTFNGLDAPSDAYVWLVEFEGGQSGAGGRVQKKGEVTLLR